MNIIIIIADERARTDALVAGVDPNGIGIDFARRLDGGRDAAP